MSVPELAVLLFGPRISALINGDNKLRRLLLDAHQFLLGLLSFLPLQKQIIQKAINPRGEASLPSKAIKRGLLNIDLI